MSTLHDEVRRVIAEIGEIEDPKRILGDADLFADLGLDSMQALEIVLEIEKRFSIQIPEEALRDIRSLDDAVEVAKRFGAAEEV